MFSFSCTLPVMKVATAAGTKVMDSTIAESKATTTVKAIGWNILPSTPVSEKIGKYTTVIIKIPKMLGLITSAVAFEAKLKRSSFVRSLPNLCCSIPKRRRQFSIMITAPSTIKPKSKAPRLIKFPDTLFSTMPVIVISMAIGITRAVMRAARKFPRRRNRITMTSNAPSARFFSTVLMVFSTKVVRS